VLDKNHFAGLGANFRGQPVDAVQDSGQIMFGLAIKEPDLHVHDEQRVHWRS
jgi:hypothetical protein